MNRLDINDLIWLIFNNFHLCLKFSNAVLHVIKMINRTTNIISLSPEIAIDVYYPVFMYIKVN